MIIMVALKYMVVGDNILLTLSWFVPLSAEFCLGR